MNPLFTGVKVIAWDMDTTLYKAIPELSIAFMNGCIEEVARVKNLDFKQAEILFKKERSKTNSTTMAMIGLEVGGFQKVWEIQKKINKASFLKKDPGLPLLFSQLSGFRHFIISNSVPEEIETVLKAIGLAKSYFEQIISADISGEPKPSLKPFQYLLDLTGLPPSQHVYVGDREKIDILPAKKLGLKTILVWGESKIADLSLPTVYEVAKVFSS